MSMSMPEGAICWARGEANAGTSNDDWMVDEGLAVPAMTESSTPALSTGDWGEAGTGTSDSNEAVADGLAVPMPAESSTPAPGEAPASELHGLRAEVGLTDGSCPSPPKFVFTM